MRLRRRLPCCLCLALAIAGCAATTRPAGSPAGELNSDAIRGEDDYVATRGEYDALPATDRQRTGKRRALVDYLTKEVTVALDRGRAEDGEAPFKQALSLYSAAELRAPNTADGPEVASLLVVARRYEIAFRKRGAHEQVLAALAVQIALGRNDQAARARLAEVIAWLEGAGAGEDDGPDGPTRVVDDLETVAKVLPAPFVIEELAHRYRVPRAAVPRGGKPSLRALRELMGEDRSGARAHELVRLFARISDLPRARTEVAALAQKTPLRGDDAELQQLLDRVLARDAQATDWVALSMHFVKQSRERGVDDRDVALRICRDASLRFEKAIEPRLCAGQLALSMDQLVVAMRSFESMRALDPARREAWEALARIYQARLFQVVTEDNLDVSGLPAQLEKVEAFHAEAQKRFPQQPLQPGLAGAVFEVGRGYYNAGKIAEAEKFLSRSVELDATPAALELLATIRLKRGDPQRAAVLIERAIHHAHGSKEEQLYRRAKLRRLLGDAIDAAGDAASSERTRRGAIEDWDVLLELGLQKEYASEALLERGKVLYALGDREDALHSFARSIDALPDRGSTYADVIAFLIPRGELAESLDAYHRALGRNEVTDYLKVYCSLWIVDLAQRAGQPEDPLALAYLRAADGNKWFDDLARWSTGRQSEAELLQRASTPARRAEASFYRALRALRGGRTDEAKSLWKEVLSTDMMAFFEFDMAGMYLKDGAPAQPRVAPLVGKPRRPAAPTPARPPTPTGEPPPDGSI